MKITIIFHGILEKYNNGLPESEEEIPEGTTVGQVVSKTGVPGDEIVFVAVNDSRVPMTTELEDGDRVTLFQFVGGG